MTDSRLIEVALPIPAPTTFTYRLKEGQQAEPGCRVLVPFGKKRRIGIVKSVSRPEPEYEVREVLQVLDGSPLISPRLLELADWLASYYLAPPGEAIRVMLPPPLLQAQKMERQGGLDWPSRMQLAVTALHPVPGLTSRQQQLWEVLAGQDLPLLVQPFLQISHSSMSTLKRMQTQGALELEAVRVERSPWHEAAPTEVIRHSLSKPQEAALDQICEGVKGGCFGSLLLHGVTGSGKTEVYLNAMQATLSRGSTALMLVPEIGLTPQTSAAIRAWFREQVAILHSALSEGERIDQWRAIREGKCKVVVGTRSAVFAPLSKLGLVIVDEEHDGSYKQEELPRYNARDTALKRAQLAQAFVVLGSATPQLETYYRCRQEKMQLAQMPQRILERPLPTVHVVDMRVEFQRHGKAAFLCELLEQSIRERLQRREQVLILLNRRGYSNSVICRSCGFTEVCENCSISLTHHLEWSRLMCHYCGYSRSVPTTCRNCGKEYIYFLGEGTEKVQEKLQRRFPKARVERMDRDSIRQRGSLQKLLKQFASGAIDLLVGTQMIAKGHDFPGVTLVGVLAAEQGLKLADFRAAERTFQLLTQVAGRAGRGSQPGDVVIQTYYPNHYALRHACAQDYSTFFRQELAFRRRFRYPPFTAVANLLARGRKEEEMRALAERVGERLLYWRSRMSAPERLRVLGPAPAAIPRIRREYRFQLLLKTTSRGELHQVLRATLGELQERFKRHLVVDIDPLNLL